MAHISGFTHSIQIIYMLIDPFRIPYNSRKQVEIFDGFCLYADRLKTRAHRRAGSKPLDKARYNDGRYKVRDFCQTEAANDVISGKGEKGD